MLDDRSTIIRHVTNNLRDEPFTLRRSSVTMLLTLWVKALKSKIAPPGGRGLAITDIPKLARDELGLSGLVMSTDLLVGADRAMLSKMHEAADKAHCPILVLAETTSLPLASDDPDVVAKAQERCYRVAQAANWLQCAAFSIGVKCANDDDISEAAINLKPVSRRAEKLELNLCIAPGTDATASADRVTDLLKKIGGFRVGTLPDFTAAMSSEDPQTYLRRLAPYASAILISADLLLGETKPVQAKRTAKSAAADGDSNSTGKPSKAKKAIKKKTSDPTAPLGASATDPAAARTVPAGKGPNGDATLADMFKVLAAVGYEQSIAMDYRGKGDPVASILAAREELTRRLGLGAEEEDDDDPIAALLAGDIDPPDAPLIDED